MKSSLLRSKYDIPMLVCAAIEVFFFGGITYGWPNLVRAFKEENYFAEGCDDYYNETRNATIETMASCTTQDDLFGMVYNIASVITGIGNILIGTAVDRLPMMATRILSFSFLLTGASFTAFSNSETSRLLIPGMLFIRIGGFLIYYTNLRLANAAPKIKGTIITLFSGVFDSSSSVLYLILLAHQGGFPVHSSFKIYAFSLFVPLLLTFVLFPTWRIDTDGKFQRFPKVLLSYFKKSASKANSHDPGENRNIQVLSFKENNKEDSTKIIEESEKKLENDVDVVILESNRGSKLKLWLQGHDMDFLLDTKFYLFLLLLSVLTMRKEFYVISYDAALVKLSNGDHQLVDHYSATFGIAQFFAILVTPISGIIIDYSRSRGTLMAYVPQFGFTLMCGSLLCICSFVQVIEILYLANALYVVCRALTYSMAAAYISDTYPIKMFGSILGTTETVGYLLAMLQYPLFAWSNGPLNQDYRPANGIILLLCVLAFAHPIKLFFYYRSKDKKDKFAGKSSGTL